jgi:hypothetical protein
MVELTRRFTFFVKRGDIIYREFEPAEPVNLRPVFMGKGDSGAAVGGRQGKNHLSVNDGWRGGPGKDQKMLKDFVTIFRVGYGLRLSLADNKKKENESSKRFMSHSFNIGKAEADS